jgi:D-alanine-D-alanine ligase-like ATP-grasp enzyme
MIRVGVLRGGSGDWYNESLASGAYILRALPKDSYEAIDVFVDTTGVWHIGGRPTTFEKLKQRVDIIWNTMRGSHGDDGKLEALLDAHGIKHIGPSSFASAVAANIPLRGGALARAGITAAEAVLVEEWAGAHDEAVSAVVKTIAQKFSPPWIVKAISRASVGSVYRARTRDELTRLVRLFAEHAIPLCVEQEVLGQTICTLVAPGFRNQSQYAFVPMVTQGAGQPLSPLVKREAEMLAGKVHAALGLGALAEVRMVVDRKGKLHVAGIETVPSFAEDSIIHETLNTVGASFSELAKHVLRI